MSFVPLFIIGGDVPLGLGRAPGDHVRLVDPAPEVDQAAALRAEREGGPGVQTGRLERLPADRAPAEDHGVEELPEAGVVDAAGFASALGSDLAAPPSPFFSALAAFLYDSLR